MFYYQVFFGFLLDLGFGDPQWFPHPVRIIGFFVNKLEHLLNNPKTSGTGRKINGAILLLLIVGGTYCFVSLLLKFATYISPNLKFILEIFLIYTSIAVHDLYKKSMDVYHPIKQKNLESARKNLSRIVGRDTANLEKEEIIRAAIECIAESTLDGIISPIFFALIGGAPLALAYKAVSTLDSMVGYNDDRYRDFGWASARFDDLANFLPARITGVLFLLTAIIFKKNFRHTLKTIKDDASKHLSPNSGIPEAAMAGILGIRLGGVNSYQGIREERGLMGQPINSLAPEHIFSANKIMFFVSVLMLFLSLLIFTMFFVSIG